MSEQQTRRSRRRKRSPGHTPALRLHTPHGEPQAFQNAAGRLAWGSGPRGQAPDYTGLDVIIVRDGKIAALYVFLDSMPSAQHVNP